MKADGARYWKLLLQLNIFFWNQGSNGTSFCVKVAEMSKKSSPLNLDSRFPLVSEGVRVDGYRFSNISPASVSEGFVAGLNLASLFPFLLASTPVKKNVIVFLCLGICFWFAWRFYKSMLEEEKQMGWIPPLNPLSKVWRVPLLSFLFSAISGYWVGFVYVLGGGAFGWCLGLLFIGSMRMFHDWVEIEKHSRKIRFFRSRVFRKIKAEIPLDSLCYEVKSEFLTGGKTRCAKVFVEVSNSMNSCAKPYTLTVLDVFPFSYAAWKENKTEILDKENKIAQALVQDLIMWCDS